jgi:hypothetical protein
MRREKMYEREKHLLHKRLDGIFENAIPDGFFIAGGALTSLFSSIQINDFDFFFFDGKGFDSIESYFKNERGIESSFVTASAISYKINGEKVQLIRKIYGSEKQIIDKFDFTICQAAYNPTSKNLILGDDFLYDLARHRLTYLSGEYPIASLRRVNKFIKKGYIFPPIEAIKLALKINDLPIRTYKDLKEQLEGIDTLFLKELTDKYIEKSDETYDYKEAIAMMEIVLSEKISEE